MQEEKQKVDRKRIVGLLTISCVATLCFAGLYVKELQKERQLEEAGMLSDASELDELRTDYIAAVNRADQAEQIENNRKLVNDLIFGCLFYFAEQPRGSFNWLRELCVRRCMEIS